VTFRQAYDALSVTHGERADVEYVRLLQLAATTSERHVDALLSDFLQERQPFDYAAVQALVSPAIPTVPAIPHSGARSRAVRRLAHGRWPMLTPTVPPPTAQVTTLLTTFGLTTAAEEIVPRLTQAGHHGAVPTLVDVFEAEAEARRHRRLARLRRAARLPPGKTFETLDAGRLPLPIMQRLQELATGAFIETATNVLAFGLPGVGKSHALCAVGHALIEAGHSVLFTPAYAVVQELLSAKRDLELPRALRKLDLFEVILLDDLGYVQQSPEEAEVLFTLLAERYERRSVMVTSNLVFSQWDRIFRDQMATAAAIDRLVHHAVLLEFDVPSYRTDRSRPTPPAPAARPPPRQRKLGFELTGGIRHLNVLSEEPVCRVQQSRLLRLRRPSHVT
jgi:DNA replication protein DnaC